MLLKSINNSLLDQSECYNLNYYFSNKLQPFKVLGIITINCFWHDFFWMREKKDVSVYVPTFRLIGFVKSCGDFFRNKIISLTQPRLNFRRPNQISIPGWSVLKTWLPISQQASSLLRSKSRKIKRCRRVITLPCNYSTHTEKLTGWRSSHTSIESQLFCGLQERAC